MNTVLNIVMRSIVRLCFCLMISALHCEGAEPLLGRLAFWVPPERLVEFEESYRTQVVPFLEKHDIIQHTDRGRSVIDSVFCDLFVFGSYDEYLNKWRVAAKDSVWAQLRLDLGTQFGSPFPSGSIRYSFDSYRMSVSQGTKTPRGSGKVFSADSGSQYWRTFRTAQGLPQVTVTALLHSREGYIWVGTHSGAGRYDGEKIKVFTQKNGLVHESISSIFQDRAGNIWFGTAGGASKYDGDTFANITQSDGLIRSSLQDVYEDRAGNMWFATNGGGVSRYTPGAHSQGSAWQSFTQDDGLVHPNVNSIVQDRAGNIWFGTEGGVCRYDGHTWQTLSSEEGLASDDISFIYLDSSEFLWFAGNNGVSRYDGTNIVNYSVKDGLAGRRVNTICEDQEGHFWFGTYDGLSQYDRGVFRTFTLQYDQAGGYGRSGYRDQNEYLWFGSRTRGVSRYDGKSFVNYTMEDGLLDNDVFEIIQDDEKNIWFVHFAKGITRDDGVSFTSFKSKYDYPATSLYSPLLDRSGNLWFGTWGYGLLRYNGHYWDTFSMPDGLASNFILSLCEDQNGHIWIGTSRGVSCYDGNKWETYTIADGLSYNQIWNIYEDQNGHIWAGTYHGLSKYDGDKWISFSTADGLAGNSVQSIFQDSRGTFWFGTRSGVSRYDGEIFQNLRQGDGLPTDLTTWILEDKEGSLWFGTPKGVVRYRQPTPVAPPISIESVVADRRYDPSLPVSISSPIGLVAFEFGGISFKTRPNALIYQYRLTGLDDAWHTTLEPRVEYKNLPVGEYTFDVKAVDRDLVYSEFPATVRLTVLPPYGMIALVACLILSLGSGGVISVYAIRKRRDLRRTEQALMAEMAKELQTAHDLQVGLMPNENPQVEGLDIAGRCIPATHVGGDFYQYFDHDGKLALALADVTGHAMAAAIPVVLFSGVLENQIRRSEPVTVLFRELNDTLRTTLDRRTFVCFAMGEIDLTTHAFRVCNSGCPYPYHFQAETQKITELEIDAYPLGISAESEYPMVEVQLKPGDLVVFCSDGIPEVENKAGEQLGFGKTEETIRQAGVEGLSAEEIIDRLFKVVDSFRGGAAQGDDMTCVVVRIEDTGADS